MPDPPSPFAAWLPKVAADPIHVDETEAGVIEEALTNLWSFGFPDDDLEGVTENAIVEFLGAVEEARERQILERFGRAHPMTFYCWVDEMIGSLRFSLVSTSHGRTGFGGPVDEVTDLIEIAQQYLSCGYHDGIPMGEFKVMTQEDIDNYVEPPSIVPRVWSCVLPRDTALQG